MKTRFHFNFAKNAKTFLCIAAAVIIICLGSIVFRGLDFGIDFRGGTIVTIDLHEQFKKDDAKKIVDKYLKSYEITTSGDKQDGIVISTKENLSEDERDKLFKDFKKKYDLKDKDLVSIDSVSGTVGGELSSMAIKACIIAIILMLIYITFRFEFLQGLCAIVALAHDIIIVVGVFSIFQIEVNSSFIAALLTILGYSINDTIVTFDRIRENTPLVDKGDYKGLLNNSVNQTLKRSIFTSITTLLAIIPLIIIGTGSIQEFAFPMIVGFIAGTFSSIFIASPLWYLIKEKEYKAQVISNRPISQQPNLLKEEEMTEEELEVFKEARKIKRKQRKKRDKKSTPGKRKK